MKRFGILFSLSVICSLACHGLTTEYDTYNELPIVFINTVNAEEPTCDYVEPPEGGGKSEYCQCHQSTWHSYDKARR